MRKYGKYEKTPDGTRAKQPEPKAVLLQTYFTSLVCMVLCITMFFGTTFAWFTSEVVSEGNEIYIGTLDAKLELLKDGTWHNVEAEPDVKLYDDTIAWEPGYTSLETIKITNEGDLSFRYALTFTDGTLNGNANDPELLKIAKHFTVYVHAGEFNDVEDPKPASFADIKASAAADDGTWRAVQMGKNPATLADILEKGFPVLSGNIEENADTYVIALHMSETAGEGATQAESIQLSKALMGQKIGLNVKLTCYQRTHEADAFNKDYDLKAHVTNLGAMDIISTCGPNGGNLYQLRLDSTYQFQPVESKEELSDSNFKNYYAEFVVWSDADIPANSVALAGYYKAWCNLINDDNWVYLDSADSIQAGMKIPLVTAMAGAPIVSYELLLEYGNDGIGFLCGIKNLSSENVGKVIHVELRMYESQDSLLEDFDDDEVPGNYIVAGRYDYTLETPRGTIDPVT